MSTPLKPPFYYLMVKPVINNSSQEQEKQPQMEILASFSYDDQELAYAKAREFEELGLEVLIQTSTVIESLAMALNISVNQQQLEQELQEEMDQHED
jgi:hypothetical protein